MSVDGGAIAERLTASSHPVLYEVSDAGVALGAAVDLLFSGRIFAAEEAAELGMVNEVLPAEQSMDRTLSYADEMARNCAPSSLAVTKQQLYAGPALSVVETSHLAEALMHQSTQRPDFIEGITAFLEKRSPNFPPLTAREDV